MEFRDRIRGIRHEARVRSEADMVARAKGDKEFFAIRDAVSGIVGDVLKEFAVESDGQVLGGDGNENGWAQACAFLAGKQRSMIVQIERVDGGAAQLSVMLHDDPKSKLIMGVTLRSGQSMVHARVFLEENIATLYAKAHT